MRLLERHQELVERDASEISILWKLLQMLFYLVSAVSGYVASYTFYTLQDSLNHRCLLWAIPNFEHGVEDFFRRTNDVTEKPWQERLKIRFKSDRHCYSILLISMLSFICGVIGFSFFTICGRGGYNRVRVYRAPWRLVCPAIVFNVCLSLLTLEAACDLEHGFQHFRNGLNKLLNRTGNQPLREYIELRAQTDLYYVVWKHYQITKGASWIGAVAWTLGLMLLMLRVMNVTDFKLIRVSKYASKPTAEEPQGNDPPEDTQTAASHV